MLEVASHKAGTILGTGKRYFIEYPVRFIGKRFAARRRFEEKSVFHKS